MQALATTQSGVIHADFERELDTNTNDDTFVDPVTLAFRPGQTNFDYNQLSLPEVEWADGGDHSRQKKMWILEIVDGAARRRKINAPFTFVPSGEDCLAQIGSGGEQIDTEKAFELSQLPDSLILGSAELHCVEPVPAVIPRSPLHLPTLASAQIKELPMSVTDALAAIDTSGMTTFRGIRGLEAQAVVEAAVQAEAEAAVRAEAEAAVRATVEAERTARQIAAHEAKTTALAAERKARYESSPKGMLDAAKGKVASLEMAFSEAVSNGNFDEADGINDQLTEARAEVIKAQATFEAHKAQKEAEHALSRAIPRTNYLTGKISELSEIITIKNTEVDKDEITRIQGAIQRYSAEILELAPLVKKAEARKAEAAEDAKPQQKATPMVTARCGKEISIWDALVPHFGEVERRSNISVTTGMTAEEIYVNGDDCMISCNCEECVKAIQGQKFTLGRSMRSVQKWDDGRGARAEAAEARKAKRNSGNGRRTGTSPRGAVRGGGW